MATIYSEKHGLTVRCSDCLCQNGAWLIPCHGGTTCETPIGYLTCKKPPHYPVPATDVNACIAAPYEAIMPISKAWIFRHLKY